MTLHVAVSGWLLGQPSGANRRLLALLQHVAPLLRDDERVTVLHRADFAPAPLHARVDWRAVPIPAGPPLARARAERRHLPTLLTALGANVFDHGLLPLPTVPVPTVLTLHDLRAADGLTRWPRWLARRVLRRATAQASAVVVPSRFTALRVATLADGRRCEVIGNGVELPPANTSAVANGDHLLHVGHLEPRKNLGVLLRALARIEPSSRPELRLVGRDAGAGPRLRALAERLGVAAHVRWLGVLDDDAMTAQLRSARAIVVPSRYEGFGMAALEGLAHGRPVLVAAAGALPEVVGEVGQVLPPDDADAWAAAIAASADAGEDPARRAQAAQFSWPDAAARLLAVWRIAAQRSSTISP